MKGLRSLECALLGLTAACGGGGTPAASARTQPGVRLVAVDTATVDVPALIVVLEPVVNGEL